jgi:hypothetical protein
MAQHVQHGLVWHTPPPTPLWLVRAVCKCWCVALLWGDANYGRLGLAPVVGATLEKGKT